MNNRIRKIVENIKNLYKGYLLFDEPMKLHTTMQVGGISLLFAEPKDIYSLILITQECKKNNVRFFVLGGGSNLIVDDKGFDGVIISTNSLSKIELKDNFVVCDSGAKTNDVVEFFANNGIFGMETFAGLPGTCGGACFMNARCYSVDISSKIQYIEYLDLEKIEENSTEFVEKHIKMYHNTSVDSEWSYKHSPFMEKKAIILKVAFKVEKVDLTKIGEIKANSKKFLDDRIKKGHFRAPSSGSVFKNNYDFGEPSGKLIDKVGLKGFKIGEAQIAPWHGNIIINTGNATASDVKDLVHLVQQKVHEHFGLELESEVIFI